MNSEDWFNGYREGSKDKREELARLLEKWRIAPEWSPNEVRKAAIAIIRNGRLP